VLVLALVVIAALAAWMLRGRLFPAPRGGAVAVGVPQQPVPGLTLQQESSEATQLINEGRSIESLPYYRHLLAALPANWQVRFNYVTGITNSALESRHRPLNAAPCARSSIERIEMLREGLAQLDLIDKQVGGSHERAMVRDLRGRLYKNWGFPWDATIEFREAEKLDPSWRQLARNADFYVWLIRHPEVDLDTLH
jgi:hypothetical protein